MHSFPQYALGTCYYDKCTQEFVRTKSLALHIYKASTLEESHLSEDYYVIWKVLCS